MEAEKVCSAKVLANRGEGATHRTKSDSKLPISATKALLSIAVPLLFPPVQYSHYVLIHDSLNPVFGYLLTTFSGY